MSDVPPPDAPAGVVCLRSVGSSGSRSRCSSTTTEPARFHARHAQGNAKLRIDTLEVIDSGLPRRQVRFVLAWAELHQGELRENWRRARAGERLKSIEPLR
jgi:Domain of unknown function (DUF4160)